LKIPSASKKLVISSQLFNPILQLKLCEAIFFLKKGSFCRVLQTQKNVGIPTFYFPPCGTADYCWHSFQSPPSPTKNQPHIYPLWAVNSRHNCLQQVFLYVFIALLLFQFFESAETRRKKLYKLLSL